VGDLTAGDDQAHRENLSSGPDRSRAIVAGRISQAAGGGAGGVACWGAAGSTPTASTGGAGAGSGAGTSCAWSGTSVPVTEPSSFAASLIDSRNPRQPRPSGGAG